MPNPRFSPILILFLLVSITAAAGGPFLDLGVDDALKRAAEEEKVVFIDFFADWCGPCKEMDKTTFADEKVIEWLSKHTVPLKVDTDRDKATAQRYRVRVMPTLLFLRADGTELQRVEGLQTVDQLMALGADIVENPDADAVARARAALETGNWPEAMARHRLGSALLMAGEKDEALAEYLKALDSLGTDFMSLRYRPRLVRDICAMAGDHPPAREVVAAEREKLVALLVSGEGDRETLEKIIDIDLGLDRKDQTLALYDRLKEKGDVPAEVLGGFCTVCRQALLERGD
jgi:thioredoxin-like negative regulator of GroEL